MKHFCMHPKSKVHYQDLALDRKFASGVIQKQKDENTASTHSNEKGENVMNFHSQF